MKLPTRRVAVATGLLVIVIVLGVALPRLGSWLVAEDPLVKADAIFVLGGTRFERPLEAHTLFAEGWAPVIVLVQQLPSPGEDWLAQRGIQLRREVDDQVDVLVQLGVPRDAIQIIAPQDSTAAEANALRATMRAQGWSTVIVVTSKQHTRRAGFAMRRVVDDAGRIIVRASRFDVSNPDRWWADRSTVRFTLFESQRLLAYWLGLRD